MFGHKNVDLLETLKSLKSTQPVQEKVEKPKPRTELDLLARAHALTNEGQLPSNPTKEDINAIIKKLTEMAVKEEGEGSGPADKIYFGTSGQNVYYAIVDKDEKNQLQSLKLYDITDEEVKSYEDLGGIANAEVIYNAVNDLSLDSVSYQLLVDLDLLKKPEEEKPAEPPKEEEPKPEEKPAEEPKAEETPAPEEEEEVEEPIGDSVQVGETILFKKVVEGINIKEGAKAKIKSFDAKESVAVIECEIDGKLAETKITLAAMKEGCGKMVMKKKVKESAEVNTDQKPKEDGKVKTDGAPAAAPKVDPAGAAGTSDAPVTQKKDPAKDDVQGKAGDPAGVQGGTVKDGQPKNPAPPMNPNQGATVKPEGTTIPGQKGDDTAPKKPNPSADVKLKNTTTYPVLKDAVEIGKAYTELAEQHKDQEIGIDFVEKRVVFKVGEEVVTEIVHELSEADVDKVKQNVSVLNIDKSKVKEPKLLGVKKVGESKLDAPDGEVYRKELTALEKQLEDKKITPEEFNAKALELSDKYKAAPAGTTEGKVPTDPSKQVDQKMIDTLLEKYGLKGTK